LDFAAAVQFAADSMGALDKLGGSSEDKLRDMLAVTDLLVTTAGSAAMNMEDLVLALTTGSSVGLEIGASMEDIAVMAAALANVGIKGTRAATSIKNVMQGLSGDTPAAQRAMKELGVSMVETVDGVEKFRKPLEVFKDLQIAISKVADPKKVKLLTDMFGMIGLPGGIKLIKNATGAMDELEKRINNYDGKAAKQANFMNQTLKARFLEFAAYIESVKIELTSMSEGPLVDLLKQWKEWIELNKDWLKTKVVESIVFVAENFKDLVKWAKRLIIVVTTLWAISTALQAVASILAIVNFLAVANPFVLIAMAVIGLIALLIQLTGESDNFIENVENFARGLGVLGGGIADWWHDMKNGAEALANPLETIYDLFQLLPESVKKAMDSVGEFFSAEAWTNANLGVAPLGGVMVPRGPDAQALGENSNGPQVPMNSQAQTVKVEGSIGVRAEEGTEATVQGGGGFLQMAPLGGMQ
jgi:TP901 family phage tail tape measure protein